MTQTLTDPRPKVRILSRGHTIDIDPDAGQGRWSGPTGARGGRLKFDDLTRLTAFDGLDLPPEVLGALVNFDYGPAT